MNNANFYEFAFDILLLYVKFLHLSVVFLFHLNHLKNLIRLYASVSISISVYLNPSL